MYGPVRTVVWEGRGREAPPYPDWTVAEKGVPSSGRGILLERPAPPDTDGTRAFIVELREQGISESDIDMMARRNPARLLGLVGP